MAKDTNKEFIYFPSFTSQGSSYRLDKKLDDKLTFKFWKPEWGKWQHKFFLLSAGEHLEKKNVPMDVRERNDLEDALVFGDSGGFQIATGVLEYSKDLTKKSFEWLEANSDIAMQLDVPPKIKYTGRFEECLELSLPNFKYFNENQSGKTRFLNVIQSEYGKEQQYETWYKAVKDFDFGGWAIGGGIPLVNRFKGLSVLLKNREFEKKTNAYLHILGATSMFDFWIYARMQKHVNENYDHLTITTDSSSPIMYANHGSYIVGYNFKGNMSFETISLTNKQRVEYPFDLKIPTPIDNPITELLGTMKRFDDDHADSGRSIIYHNLCCFLHAKTLVTRLANLPLQVLGNLSSDCLKVLQSIDDMFENPDLADKIFQKNKKVYEKFSNEPKHIISNETSDIVFNFDENDLF